jgi:hypothetical protein
MSERARSAGASFPTLAVHAGEDREAFVEGLSGPVHMAFATTKREIPSAERSLTKADARPTVGEWIEVVL